MAREAGFMPEGDPALLRNPAEAGLKSVDPEIRGKTDQVLVAFSKP